jgi:hypothetical protein
MNGRDKKVIFLSSIIISPVSKPSNLIHEIDAMEAFGFWLRCSTPGWRISRPEIELLNIGEGYAFFVLYQAEVPLGTYKSPMEALARIGDDNLTRNYLSVISTAEEPPKDEF